jgi:hypothetical protein
MNRRQLLTSSVATAATLISSRIAVPMDAVNACLSTPTLEQRKKPDGWIRLGEMLQEENSHFGGLTRIVGHKIVPANAPVSRKASGPPPWSLILDKPDKRTPTNVPTPPAQDIILYGRIEPGEPELRFDDLIVAIKSVHGDYGRGSGVSPEMNPDPQLAEALDKAEAIRKQDNYRSYFAVCKKLFNYPSIDGMPKDWQTAKTLLDADYCMKLVVLGMAKLPIKDFKSTIELQNERYIAAIKATNDYPKELASEASRFWFLPSDPIFITTASESFIESAPIVLKTEKKNPNNPGDPDYLTFACAWNNKMQEILKSELIWKQMNNIFRFYALAKILNDGDMVMKILGDRRSRMPMKMAHASIPTQYPVMVDGGKKVDVKINGRPWNWTNGGICGGISLEGRIVKRTLDITKDRRAYDELHSIGERVLASALSSKKAYGTVQ